jgi:GNAT superfamily N-acetyltransferase
LTTLTTRSSTEADAQLIGEISYRSHTISFGKFTRPGFVQEQDQTEQTDWWKQFLTPTDIGLRMFVVERDHDVIGFTMIGPLTDRYEFFEQTKTLGESGAIGVIYSIHVDPDHLGGGAGTVLMQTALDHLRQVGITTVVLDTYEKNERARRFYDAGGWEVSRMAESHEAGTMAIYRIRLD